ncbi:MAG: MAPEG family protein [Pseudohongiellaceae bacterium]
MEYVIIVACLILIQYMVFGFLVGKARSTYNVPAPATSGDPIFERYWRVHQNTLEQIVIFLPSMVMFAYWGNPIYAAAAGVVFFIGRLLYLRGYVSDPGSRGTGFLIGFLATVVVLLGSLIHAVMALL